MERKEKATAFVEKMMKEEKNGQLRLAVQEGKMLTAKDLEKYHQGRRADPECNGQQPGADQLARNGQNGIAERYRKGIDSH